MLVNKLHGVVAEQRDGITLLFDYLVVPIPVHDAVLLMSEVVNLADQRAVLVIEPALPRPVFGIAMTKMPLANDGGLVAGLLECLRQQPFVGRQAIRMGRGDDAGL